MNRYGDIKLGTCNNEEILSILDFIKKKYLNGCHFMLKQIMENDEWYYYLSVPIQIGSYVDTDDPTIYVTKGFSNNEFYFEDLYAVDPIIMITYSQDGFISNKNTEGCIHVPDFEIPNCLYEILPICEDTEEDKIRYVKSILKK